MIRPIGIAAVLALSGCMRLPAQTVVVRTAETPAPHAPTAASQVELVIGAPPSRAYVVLGLVAVESHWQEDPLALLRAGAARLGADAVMRIRLERIPGGVGTRGVAIAYTDQPR